MRKSQWIETSMSLREVRYVVIDTSATSTAFSTSGVASLLPKYAKFAWSGDISSNEYTERTIELASHYSAEHSVPLESDHA